MSTTTTAKCWSCDRERPVGELVGDEENACVDCAAVTAGEEAVSNAQAPYRAALLQLADALRKRNARQFGTSDLKRAANIYAQADDLA